MLLLKEAGRDLLERMARRELGFGDLLVLSVHVGEARLARLEGELSGVLVEVSCAHVDLQMLHERVRSIQIIVSLGLGHLDAGSVVVDFLDLEKGAIWGILAQDWVVGVVILLHVGIVVDIKALNWLSAVVVHGKFTSKGLDVQAKVSGKAIHSVVLCTRCVSGSSLSSVEGRLVLSFSIHGLVVELLAILDLVESVGEPCLGVATKLVGVLCLHDLARDPLRRSNVALILLEDALELVVLLLGVPVPLVDLLELEAALLGEVLQLTFGWLSF